MIGGEAKALAQNSSLTTLDLVGQWHRGRGGQSISTELFLDHTGIFGPNGIGDEGAKALAQNSSLTTLNLEYNGIGDEGPKH
jgi:hypothetical protein